MSINPVLVLGLVVVIGSVVAWEWSVRRHRKLIIGRRPCLESETWYTTFYGQSDLPKEKVLALRDELAEAISVPAGTLRPDDRFNSELAPPKGWEYDDGLFVLLGNKKREVNQLGVRVDWERIQTVDDWIGILVSVKNSDSMPPTPRMTS